jgi:hypothetical protein
LNEQTISADVTEAPAVSPIVEIPVDAPVVEEPQVPAEADFNTPVEAQTQIPADLLPSDIQQDDQT